MSILWYKFVFFKNVKSPLHHKMAIWNGQLWELLWVTTLLSPCGSLVWTEYQSLKRKRAEDCTHARWTKVEPEGKKVLSSQSFFLSPFQPLLLFTVYLQNFTFSIVARSSWGKTTAHGLTVRIAWLTPFKKTVTEEDKNQWYVRHHAISAQTKPFYRVVQNIVLSI